MYDLRHEECCTCVVIFRGWLPQCYVIVIMWSCWPMYTHKLHAWLWTGEIHDDEGKDRSPMHHYLFLSMWSIWLMKLWTCVIRGVMWRSISHGMLTNMMYDCMNMWKDILTWSRVYDERKISSCIPLRNMMYEGVCP